MTTQDKPKAPETFVCYYAVQDTEAPVMEPTARCVRNIKQAVEGGVKSPYLRSSSYFKSCATGAPAQHTTYYFGHVFRRADVIAATDPARQEALRWMDENKTDVMVALRTRQFIAPQPNSVVLDPRTGRPLMKRPATGPDRFYKPKDGLLFKMKLSGPR